MALLTITALDDGGAPIVTGVQIYLSDLNGNSVRAFTNLGVLVQGLTEKTDSNGELTVDLPPNVTITTPNTYYTVVIGNREPVLILKGTGSQTLEDAVAVAPEALGIGATFDNLADVDLTGLQVNDFVRWDGSSWGPFTLPGGTVPAYLHNQGTPSTTWVVNHALGRHPVVAVLDSSGREMIAQVDHNSLNQATVTLLVALTGTVECR
jgi:hypothetical protein